MSSIGAMRLLFQAGSRTIAGNLAGKFLCCTMRPPQGGALPPAGDYVILPPMNDPIYGRVALMAPVGRAGGIRPELTMQKCLATATFLKPDVTPAAVSGKLLEKPLGAAAIGAKVFQKPGATATSIGAKVFEKPLEKRGAGAGQVFVLSDRPVLGRNCVVVSSGFADLMDSLQTAGGAGVTVA